MPATTAYNLATTTSHPPPPPRKTRPVKRRGRGKNDFGSDDEFVREVGTDSESDDGDRSSADSDTDSDTEPVSEDILSAAHSRILTPNTTQSSADAPPLNESASKQAPLFSEAGNWSEMVTEENANGPAELPVIEFADFSGPSSVDQRHRPASQRKPTRPSKRPPVKRTLSAPTVDHPAVPTHVSEKKPEESILEPVSDQPIASTSRLSSRSSLRHPSGQSARQAYQQRLETDPSYVPKVGEFWGHDDRLLDKDLRSLSRWWRGQWQGRGRGRGSFDRGFVRPRARGASLSSSASALRGTQSEDGLTTQEKSPAELPPVDQPWTHDRFEEMKKREEKKREAVQQQPSPRPTRGFVSLRGRGGFAGRGRGGATRGGGVTHQLLRPNATTSSSSGKIWYAMKPEYPWTKQLETSLFHDSGLKPRHGTGPTYRVKLPNTEMQVVRGSTQVAERPKRLSSSETQGSDDGEKNFVVRLPKWVVKHQEACPFPVSANTVQESHLEDVFTVRPELVPPRAPIVDIKLPPAPVVVETSVVASTATPLTQPIKPSAPLSSPASLSVEVPPTQSAPSLVDGVLHEHQDALVPTLLKVDTPHAHEPQEIPGPRRVLPPAPPPLQTVFPPPQSSPPYSSPYGYGSPLPPGIAISQHGMAYEVATGRPVYLPAPIYTPRPLAHGMMTPPGVSYIPGHMHHPPAGSPDFLSAPHTPPLNGFVDPTTGSPIFAFPRQSSRIEIRAPSQLEPKSIRSQRRPSNLRTSAAAFEPSRPSSPVMEAHLSAPQAGQYPEAHGDAGAALEQPVDSSMYNYTAYQPTYYYPEQYGYPHSQYYDMSHMSRYEMYQTDLHSSQAVYY